MMKLYIFVLIAIFTYISTDSTAQESVDKLAMTTHDLAIQAHQKIQQIEYDIEKTTSYIGIEDLVVHAHVIQASTDHDSGMHLGLYRVSGTITQGEIDPIPFEYGYTGDVLWVVQHDEGEVVAIADPTYERIKEVLGRERMFIALSYFTNPTPAMPYENTEYQLTQWSPEPSLVGFEMKWVSTDETYSVDVKMAFDPIDMICRRLHQGATAIQVSNVEQGDIDTDDFHPNIPEGYNYRDLDEQEETSF